MPIGTDQDALKSNGDISNSLLNSLEDEDSFVVLERLTANDVELPGVSIQSLHTFQPFSNSGSFPTFNNLPTSGLSSNRNNLLHSQFEIPVESQFGNISTSVSAEDIQKQLQEVLRENVNLKENLFQTNLAMKQHMSTVRLLQERASEVQKNHQAKFEDTKSLILQLGSEKSELQEANSLLTGELNKAKQEIKEVKESNLVFGNEMSKILAENDTLKKQLMGLHENIRTFTENNKKASLQPSAKELELHELVDQLTRKLEVVERSRRQQEFDIDRLKAQLGRSAQELNETQQKLAHAEHSLQATKEKPLGEVKSESCSTSYQEKLVMYNDLIEKLKTSAQEELTRCDSLCSWLNVDPIEFEISELRRLLAEEQSHSVAKKESLSQAISAIQDLLSDYKKIAEKIDLLKADHANKESHTLAYEETQKKGYIEQLDALTVKLFEKEEELAISQRHLASLEEAVRLQNMEKKGSSKTLEGEQIQCLSKQLAIKEDQLQEKSKEVNLLKSEVERLQTIAAKFTVLQEQKSAESLKEQQIKKDLSKQLEIKEAQLQANEKERDLLKSEVERLQNIAETVTILQQQVNIYKDDFEAERKCRESLAAEKDRLLEDFRDLEQRNQKLIEDRNGQPNQHLPTAPPAQAITRQENSPSTTPPKPRQRQFSCPSCNQPFNLQDLQLHVIQCWGLQD